jgi:hypothetical protein
VSKLDRIYIRELNAQGKWDSLSLAEVTEEQFTNWLGKWILRMAGNRTEAINCLVELGIPPAEATEQLQETLNKGVIKK